MYVQGPVCVLVSVQAGRASPGGAGVWHCWNLSGGFSRIPSLLLCVCGDTALAQFAPDRLNQFSSVTESCPTLCDPMNRSMPGLPVYHQLPEPTQTHVH